MAYQIAVQTIPEQPIAVVRAQIKFEEISQRLLPLFDRVYAEVRRGAIMQAGHNVVVYRDSTPGSWEVEVGVQVAAPFRNLGEVVCSSTPGGAVAMTTHRGAYHRLAQAHQALAKWCREHERAHTGVGWEIYGDWNDDETQLHTDVLHLLR